MDSIRIHIKAVLNPYGFLSGALLDRYVPIWYYMKPYWCPVNSCWVPSGTLQIWAPTKINLGFAAQKTKNAYFLPLSTAPVPCKSQIISNIDDRSELVLSMRCCSQLVRSSWLLFPTSAQLVGNGFAGLSLVPWTSVIQNGRPTFRSYGPISTHI